MESKNNELNDGVKAKFDNFTPPVPADLWNKIEMQLDATAPTKANPKIGARRPFYVFGGAIAATLLISFAFWNLRDSEVIHLTGGGEEYASSNLKGIEPEPGVQKEKVLETAPTDIVKKQEKAIEQVMPLTKVEKIHLLPEGHLENDPHEVDYNTLHAKSTLTFPVSDVSLVAEEALPLEEQVIVFQESLSVSEDQQNSVVEEENSSRKKVRVSTVLNFIAKGLTNENGNSIEFSESEDGILKLDLKLGFAKSKD